MLIPEHDEVIIEKAIYLPLLVTILTRDLKVIDNSEFKIKEPYIHKVEDILKTVHRDLNKTKKYMFDNKIKVVKSGTEGSLTRYLIIYKGYEKNCKYYNPLLKRRSEEFLEEYMLNRKSDPPA